MSEEKKQKIDRIARHYWVVLVLTAAAVVLIFAGFCLPPPGEIDSSVLAATGELLGFAALITFIIRSEAGADVTFKHHDTEISMNNPDPHGRDDFDELENL